MAHMVFLEKNENEKKKGRKKGRKEGKKGR